MTNVRTSEVEATLAPINIVLILYVINDLTKILHPVKIMFFLVERKI